MNPTETQEEYLNLTVTAQNNKSRTINIPGIRTNINVMNITMAWVNIRSSNLLQIEGMPAANLTAAVRRNVRTRLLF